MKVTDEQVHDGKELPELVDDIKKPDRKTTVCKLFADGAYDDGNDVFRYRRTMESCLASKQERTQGLN